jgi:hypothetical protein
MPTALANVDDVRRAIVERIKLIGPGNRINTSLVITLEEKFS